MMESRPSSVQLVDCRSFLNYNADRITGSVNIFCPPLVKKRFSSSVLPLSTMLSAETRATLCRSVVDAVVMYDDDTDEESWQSRRCDLQLVMDSLMLFLQPGRITFYVLAGKAKNHVMQIWVDRGMENVLCVSGGVWMYVCVLFSRHIYTVVFFFFFSSS